jgi:hypothetical protein
VWQREELAQASMAEHHFYLLSSALGTLLRGQRQEDALLAVYGSGDGYNVTMAGRADERDAGIARAALQTVI